MFHERPRRSRLTNARAIVIITIALGLTAAMPTAAAPIVDSFGFNLDTQYGSLFFAPAPGERATIPGWNLGGGRFLAGQDSYDILDGIGTLTSGLFESYTAVPIDAQTTFATTVFDGLGRLDFAFTIALPGGGTHDVALHAMLGPLTVQETICIPNFGLCGGLVDSPLVAAKIDGATAALFGVSPQLIPSFGMFMFSDVYTGAVEEIPGHFDRIFGHDLDFGTQVPEPSTLLLLGAGVAFVARRRRRH